MIKSRRVVPEVDHMLNLMTEGRKAALDIRAVLPDAPRLTHSKVNAVVDKIIEFYRQTQNLRSAQVVFSDYEVPGRR